MRERAVVNKPPETGKLVCHVGRLIRPARKDEDVRPGRGIMEEPGIAGLGHVGAHSAPHG